MHFHTTYHTSDHTPYTPSNLLSTSYFSPEYQSLLARPSDSAAVPEETVDALTALTFTASPPSPVSGFDRFLHRKQHFAAHSIEDLLGSIYERESLKDEAFRAIDYASCELRTKILETGEWLTGANPQLDKTRGQIERNLLALDQEKRREEVSCWRDVIRLKSELREALREFDHEHHKTAFINAPWKLENSSDT